MALHGLSQSEFNARADAYGARAGVRETLHGYFLSHRSRLYESCHRFGLFERSLGDVLEIGPFYSYTPLILRESARSYAVLEGDDPACTPLAKLYSEHGVTLKTLDLFGIFGSERGATHRLPYEDDSFDTVLCWETLEHFNFNPVPFVRELWRVTRPGARLTFTVPNRASGETLLSLLTHRNQRSGIDAYFKFADYEHHGRRAFFGFHWREYTLPELVYLFEQAGFHIADRGWLMTFQDAERLSPIRKAARASLRTLCRLRPSLGKNCYLVAEKPREPVHANNS